MDGQVISALVAHMKMMHFTSHWPGSRCVAFCLEWAVRLTSCLAAGLSHGLAYSEAIVYITQTGWGLVLEDPPPPPHTRTHPRTHTCEARKDPLTTIVLRQASHGAASGGTCLANQAFDRAEAQGTHAGGDVPRAQSSQAGTDHGRHA